MKKFLFLTGLLIMIFRTADSQSTSSPYSYFGLGLEEVPGTGVNHGLGGTGIALKSDKFLNNVNPASYDGIDSLSFIFELGAVLKYTRSLSYNESGDLVDANLKYLAMGFRLKPWWATSLGIRPYSSTGYNITSTGQIEGELSEYNILYTGNGGLNQVYFGNSFSIMKNLSAGINATYLFGTTEHKESIDSNPVITGGAIAGVYKLNNFMFDMGLQYSYSIGGYSAVFGIIYSPSKVMTANYTLNYYNSTDTIILDAGSDHRFALPANAGAGFSINKGDIIRIAMDFSTKNWSDFKLINSGTKTKDTRRLSAGIEYSPGRKYSFKKENAWTYRFGTQLNNSCLGIDNRTLIQRSLTAGVGIPLRADRSRINLSLELGDFGLVSKDLLKERFVMFHLNVSMQDKWFYKRKFE